MGFDRGSGGGFPDLPAKIVNIGIDYVEYETNSQHRIVVVFEPLSKESPLNTQTNMLNTSNELVTGGKEEVLFVGSEENGFSIDIVGDIVVNGTIGGKAKVWLDKLEELGYDMTNLEHTGDLAVLVGIEAEWRQMTYSEAVKREPNAEYPEKKFWMPVKLLKKPAVQKTIDQEINEVIDGKTEDKMIDFAKDKGMRVSTVIQKIDEKIEKGDIRMVDNRYEVITK
jgi:hypothetical protein